jgi:hypothetical protein
MSFGRGVLFAGVVTAVWAAPFCAYAADLAKKQVAPARPEIGAVSRSTGHLFREGLASGIIAEGHDLQKQSDVTPNDFGVLTDARSGSLGEKLWEGMSADDLADMMVHLSPARAVPPAQTLARRMVLTEAPWPGGGAMLALRLEKMMEYGLVDETAHLYAHLSPENPNSDLLRVAVPALVMAGDVSTACLELQTHDSHIKDGGGFTGLTADALCGADRRAHEWPVLKVEALSNLVPVDLARVYGGRVRGLDWASFKLTEGGMDLSPAIAHALVRDLTIPMAVRLAVYDAVASAPVPEGTGDDLGASGSVLSTDRMVTLYKDQEKNGAAGADARARDVLRALDGASVRMYALFAPTFLALSPDVEMPNQDIRKIAGILLATHPKAADPWIARLRSDYKPEDGSDIGLSALILLGQMRGLPAANGPIPLSFSTFSSQSDKNLLAIFKNLSDLLDTAPDFIDNPPVVYEKSTGLTAGDRYVMSVSMLRTHLMEGAKNGQIGRVVLASLLVLQTKDPLTIDADVVADMIKSLVAVGLGEEARQIATYVCLGVILKGEQKHGTSRSSGTTETKSASVD